MPTVFSYITQKRLSRENENVATEALAYILRSSEAARRGMTRLICGIIPDLPPLHFRAQWNEGEIRPDMRGIADNNELRVFVENKFWAGLTDNQPVSYLQRLAEQAQPTLLLVIAPAAREHTLKRELDRRLRDNDIYGAVREPGAGVVYSVDTRLGPIIALTSWGNVLSVLEHETVDDPGARCDLVQLRALCDAADIEAFIPCSNQILSDQKTPAFILQLSSIVEETVACAEAENILSIDGLRWQSDRTRIGRYVWVPGREGAGAWFGTYFTLWKSHGATPLWLFFLGSDWGRGAEVRQLILPWAERENILTADIGQGIAIALNIPAGEEKDGVIRSLVNDIREITEQLVDLPPRAAQLPDQEGPEGNDDL